LNPIFLANTVIYKWLIFIFYKNALLTTTSKMLGVRMGVSAVLCVLLTL